jgi:hypothetical protein
MSTISDPIRGACDPLFRVLPIERAMPKLLVARPADSEALEAAATVVSNPEIAGHPSLVAGIWLYVDDLDRSHRSSQTDDSTEGAMWHSIMHRREGDFDNSRYWLRRAGGLPAFAGLDRYDPLRMIRDAEEARGADPAPLVELQRLEWLALFSWCSRRV